MGNPVAVVLDGEGLSDEAMRQFARWTNLSETTFVLPATEAGADYRLRIFTPAQELPFAGHPTLGSAHAVIEAHELARPQVVQQCEAGLVTISADSDGLSFRLPRAEHHSVPDPEALRAAIGTKTVAEPALLDVGPRWVIAQLADAAAVAGFAPDLNLLAEHDRRHCTGLTVFAEDGAGGVKVRSFAPADGIAEDPVCGSGNGAVAAYRLASGAIGPGDSYAASQGREIGRDGRITVRIDEDGGIHVGGSCVTCISGQVML